MKTLKNVKWKDFPIQEIFYEIQRGKRLKNEDHIPGNMPYVSSSAINNGIDDFVSNEEKVRMFKDCITIANSGSVGASFYHPYTFVASDHVTQLKRQNSNKYIYLFLATISSRLSEKYSFNREINESRIKRERLLIPATPDGSPDFKFMEQYMRGIEKKLLKRYARYLENKGFSLLGNSCIEEGKIDNTERWKDYSLLEIFSLKATRSSIDKKNLSGIEGIYPYITRTDKNNGIDSFVGKQPKYKTDNDGVITIGLDTQSVFYQQYEFYTGQNVQILSNRSMNLYVASFMIPLIKNQLKKFNWGGNGATLGRLKKIRLMLPATPDGSPDYNFMEQYMREKEQKLIRRYIEYRLKKV